MDDKNITEEHSSDQEIKQTGAGKGSKKSRGAESHSTSSGQARLAGNRKVGELTQKIAELEEQLARAVADYRNQEMRFEDEKREFVKFANRDLLLRLIPAFDTLFLAEKYVADEGIKITIRHLREALREVGAEQVKTEGEMFDASKMEAVTIGEGEEGKVLEELRPGYTLNGKLIRPALVKVGKS